RFKEMTKVGPKSLQAREDLAGLLARHGLNAEALAEYEAVRALIRLDNMKVALTLREIGGLRDKLGKTDEAIAAYKQALKLLTKAHWLRRELQERIVDVHRKRGTLAALADEYEARAKRGRDPEVHFLLAKLSEELGRDARAVKALQAALKL